MSSHSEVTDMRDTIQDQNVVPFLQLGHDVIDEKELFDNPYEKMAYIIIKRHANVNGTKAFPSVKTIAEKIPCSKRKAQDCINSLVKKRLLTKVTQFDPDNQRYHANQYTIQPFRGSAPHAGGSAQRAIPSAQRAQELYTFKNDDDEENLQKQQEQKQAFLHIQDIYTKAGWGYPNGIVTEQLLQDIQDYGKDIVGFAIETAAMNNARSYRYTQKLYNDWEQKGYTDLATIKRAIAASKQRKVPAPPSPDRDSFLLGE